MFLTFQDSIVRDAPRGAEINPPEFGVSADDFAKINPVYQRLAKELQIIDKEADAYRDAVTSGKKNLDPAVIQSFSTRRDQAIANARTELQKALTPAGWQALSAYIEGPYRKKIVRTSPRQ